MYKSKSFTKTETRKKMVDKKTLKRKKKTGRKKE